MLPSSQLPFVEGFSRPFLRRTRIFGYLRQNRVHGVLDRAVSMSRRRCVQQLARLKKLRRPDSSAGKTAGSFLSDNRRESQEGSIRSSRAVLLSPVPSTHSASWSRAAVFSSCGKSSRWRFSTSTSRKAGVDPLRRTPENGGYLPRWSPSEWRNARGASSPLSSKRRR